MTAPFAAAPAAPLTEASVQRLKTLLAEHAQPRGGMSLEMVDGLFSALITAPQPVPADEFLPLVWGGAPAFDDAATAAEANALLASLWNHIEQRIAIDPDAGDGVFMPLLTMPANLPEDPDGFADAIAAFDFPLGAAWAGGFLHAVNLRLPQWTALEQQVDGLTQSFGHLLRLIQIDAADDGTLPPDPKERVALMAAMPYMLRALKMV